MKKLNRGDKIYLDKLKTIESRVNSFLSCRDGVVECYEYASDSGYGLNTRLFLCRNHKHESVAIIRQVYSTYDKLWKEESMYFDSDSFEILEALIKSESSYSGEYTLVRDYST